MHSRRASTNPMRATLLSLAVIAMLAGCAPTQPVTGGVYDSSATERRVVANINFDFDSSRIRPDSYQVLDNVAVALNDPRIVGLRIEVDGHTDVIGRFGYNVALSMLRAQSVVQYLAARGVPQERMLPQGFGPLQLFDSYNPASPTNRRVEIVVTP